MNIGIDANCLLFERAGIGRYTRNLVKNLLEIDKKNQYFLYFSFVRERRRREKFIRRMLGSGYKNVTIRIIPMPARWYEFLISTPLPITKIIQDPIDVFFAPYAAGIPRNGFSKMMVTCHDLVFLRFPEHRGRRLSNYYLKRHKIALRNCQKIITPSRATKKDLQDFLEVSSSKIKVIYEAADERFKIIGKKDRPRAERIISRYFDPKIKYILSVGTLEPRKNLVKLIEAYSLLPHKLQQEYQLVLVGGKGWNSSPLYRAVSNLNLKDKVILTGFVSDQDLPYIYNRASIFVYPSLYEGFGLPPLEAMACGIPVITSNHSSLLEVVGSAAILVDCQKEEEIALAIKRVIAEPKLAEKMTQKGIKQAKKFSWGKAARQTLQVLENI